jgi:hypothetical protein
MINFSEYKLFRFEINKILCGKYVNMSRDFSSNEKQFKNNKDMKKISFNLNKLIIILNTIKKDNQSYGFFYSHKKMKESDTYYINLKLPLINISFQNLVYSFQKQFNIDLKRLSQLNKLRKFFSPEDIIKYSMIIKKSRYKEENDSDKKKLKKLLSLKRTMKMPYKRSVSVKDLNRNKETKLNLKKQSPKQSDNGNIKFIKNLNNNEEFIKDIKLNLDKYIFNFDESIFKYIKLKDNKKSNDNNNIKQEKNSVNENNLKYNINAKKNIELNKNSQRLDIEIGNIEMSWTNQDGLTKNVMLDKKDSEYLLDYPTSKWKFFVEQNIEKILSSDKGIIQPIKRSSKNNFIWKEFITKKEGIKE